MWCELPDILVLAYTDMISGQGLLSKIHMSFEDKKGKIHISFESESIILST